MASNAPSTATMLYGPEQKRVKHVSSFQILWGVLTVGLLVHVWLSTSLSSQAIGDGSGMSTLTLTATAILLNEFEISSLSSSIMKKTKSDYRHFPNDRSIPNQHYVHPIPASSTTDQTLSPFLRPAVTPNPAVAPLLLLVNTWKNMMQVWNLHSILEITSSARNHSSSCGFVTAWFFYFGLRPANCVVPSRDDHAPISWQITHDYASGPWWPYNKTYDATWLDGSWFQNHSDADAMMLNLFDQNVLPTLRTTAVIVVSITTNAASQKFSSSDKLALINRMIRYGFKHLHYLDHQLRDWTLLDTTQQTKADGAAWTDITLLAFINPVVASLPQHVRLFLEHGCYGGRRSPEEAKASGLGSIIHAVCGSYDVLREDPHAIVSVLPSDYFPLPQTPEMEQAFQQYCASRGVKQVPQIVDASVAAAALPASKIHGPYNKRQPKVLTPREIHRLLMQERKSRQFVAATATDAVSSDKALSFRSKIAKRFTGRMPNPKPVVPKDAQSGNSSSNVVDNDEAAFWDMIQKQLRQTPLPEWYRHFHHQPGWPSSPSPPLRQQKEKQQQQSPTPVISVVHWPLVSLRSHETAEQLHLFKDGTLQSPHLKMVQDLLSFQDDPYLVWIADPGYGDWITWCDELTKVVKTVLIERYAASIVRPWIIYVVDMTDQNGKQRCLRVEEIMGQQWVQYLARAVVDGRKWNDKRKWVDFGNVSKTNFLYLPSVPLDKTKEIYHRHIALPVRTDVVQRIQDVLNEKWDGKDLSHPIEELLDRPVHVSHFWPPTTQEYAQQRKTRLRQSITLLLQDWGTEQNWQLELGIRGQRGRPGRNFVHSAYIRALLESKIVVVTQRDGWEDHYRLLEAMVSGALVISDYMHTLPAGLQNGTSVLLFKSAPQLKSLLLYYLKHDGERIEIAKRGREIAMSRHRSWHRMEEIVFGRALTTCETLVQSSSSSSITMGFDRCPFLTRIVATQ